MSLFPIPPHSAFTDFGRYRRSVDEQREERRSSGCEDETYVSPELPRGTSDQLEPIQAAEALRDAAGYIEKYGWTQHSMWQPGPDPDNPRACALGAIAIVTTNDLDPDAPFNGDPFVQASVNAFAVHLHPDERLIVGDYPHRAADLVWLYNDRPDMTAAKVCEQLRHAADDLAPAPAAHQ
jgi:hypothetical protein